MSECASSGNVVASERDKNNVPGHECISKLRQSDHVLLTVDAIPALASSCANHAG